MKAILIKSSVILMLTTFMACGSTNKDKGQNDGKGEEAVEKTSSACTGKNEITVLKYEDEDREFKQEYVYANYNSAFKSYRVLFLNYAKSLDNESSKKGPGQMRIVVTVFAPAGGEFKPGKYTWDGDDNKMNRIAVQVDTEEGMKGCNIAGVDDPGFIEILAVTKTHICGRVAVNGKGFAVSGEFDAKHESVK